MSPTTQVDHSGVRFGNDNRDSGNSTTIIIHNENNAPIMHTTVAQPPNRTESEILNWISPVELPDKHEAVRQRRFEGVGNWLIQASEFKDWASGSANPTLFCYGDPGVGKTFISSLVIDTLCPLACRKNLRVFYLYCDYLNHKGRSATDLIAGLLRKVVTGLDKTPEAVSQEFENSKKHGDHQRRPLLQDLENLLGTVLASFDRAFICIDALDEFPVSQRLELLRSLARIVKRWPTIRLFLTGRPQIQREIELRLEGAQTMSTKSSVEEIKRYITHRLDRDPNPDEMNPGLAEEIKTTIPQKVSGIFLLAYLKMNAILDEMTVSDRRAKLMTMEDSPELQSEYDKTLVRINEQGPRRSELALRGLMLLCYSKRPLYADEWRHALAIEKRSTSLNLEKVSSIRTLLDCCFGLVTEDREASTIHLIHSTLKDYLQDNPGYFQRTNLTIAETCLTYLNFDDVKRLSPSLHIAPAETPFLQYASLYWGEHIREETTEHEEALVKKLFDQYDKHISAKLLLLENSWPWGHPTEGFPEGFSELHCLAFFGIAEIAALLMGQKAFDLDQRDITGSTPLIWAARNGHETFLELLLKKDANPAKTDINGRTPISWASGCGHDGVVKLLLGQNGARPDMADYTGTTPLSWAAWAGSTNVTTLLLDHRDVSANSSDIYGRTPLSWAAGEGHEELVKLLLSREDAEPNSADKTGRTPLSWAAGNGHDSVIRNLVALNGVEIRKADKDNMTPLSWAAWNGASGSLKLLLGEDTKPDFPDKDGRTPLSGAAGNGYEQVVELLLGSKKINPNSVDNLRRTPLMWAAIHGCEGVLEKLLKRGGCDPTTKDKRGLSSLSLAAIHGWENIVGRLLENENIDLCSGDNSDNDGRTPIWWAARKGHERIVAKMLVKMEAHSDTKDNEGQTPLLCAAEQGCDGVVKLLLGLPSVNPNSTDDTGQTPLSSAVMNKHRSTVNLLLGNHSVKSDLTDHDGRTPLSWAAQNGDEEVVQQLLKQEGVSPDLADNEGRTPLSWVAQKGHQGVATLLLGQIGVNHDSVDNDGQTPLMWAAQWGREGIVELLLGKANIDPNWRDKDGRTPLSWAADYGHEGVVRLLLERGKVDSELKDNRGRKPLCWAKEAGCSQDVVRMLQQHQVELSGSPPSDHPYESNLPESHGEEVRDDEESLQQPGIFGSFLFRQWWTGKPSR